MIYTDMTKKAIQLMFKCHRDQLDKSGLPYVFHPWHVAEQMTDEITTTVALLHDVIEDSTISDIIDENNCLKDFPDEVIEAVKLLSHLDKHEPYLDYINRIKQNPIARKVKMADLWHNIDLSRLDTVTDKDIQRRDKYVKAITILSNVDR